MPFRRVACCTSRCRLERLRAKRTRGRRILVATKTERSRQSVASRGSVRASTPPVCWKTTVCSVRQCIHGVTARIPCRSLSLTPFELHPAFGTKRLGIISIEYSIVLASTEKGFTGATYHSYEANPPPESPASASRTAPFLRKTGDVSALSLHPSFPPRSPFSTVDCTPFWWLGSSCRARCTSW